MERRVYLAALVVALLLVTVIAYSADFDIRYDPNRVTTLTGSVITTISYDPGNPDTSPMSLVLSSGRRYYTVFLGPGYFLKNLGANFRQGDLITVTASQRSINGQDYLVASRLISGKNVFDLRTPSGLPLWSSQMIGSAPIGSGPGAMVVIPFDSSRMYRTDGRIVRLETVQTSESDMPYTVAVIQPVNGFRGLTRVLIGPADVIQSANINLSRGAYLSASGSNADINGTRYLIATSVAQGTNFVNLRTSSGVPLYSVTQSGVLFSPPDNNF